MPCSKNARRRSRTPELAAILTLVLAGCGQEPVKAPVTAPEPARLVWTHNDGDLVLREDGAEVVSLTCFSGGEMAVRVASFTPVGSEERLSVGAGSTVLTLVARHGANDDPQGVRGSGRVSDDFLRALTEGRKVGVNYGAQDLGPLEGPPDEAARRFAAACAG